jgi:hypothetical protein
VDYEPSCCESAIERLSPWIEKLVENQMIFVKIREIGLGQFLINLTQLVRFIVVKLTHPDSNPRFDMSVAFTTNYSFSSRRRPRRQRDALDDRLRESQDQAASVFRRCS